MSFAPIILFVYNRPDHTRQTVEALKKNILAKESKLFVFSDGPKDISDASSVEQVREYVRGITGFESVTVIAREQNWGLAKSIIEGVSEIVRTYRRVIVLEDDIVTSRYFLSYMNDALEFYRDEEKVMHISGYMFPVRKALPATFFYNATSCWGWATWERAWQYFNPDARELLDQLYEHGQLRRFNVDNSYDFLAQLKANAEGRLNTWAIKWHTSVFLKDGLCLHPGSSLVQNIGFDASGEHCDTSCEYTVALSDVPVVVEKIPLIESVDARMAVKKFNLSIRQTLLQRVVRKIAQLYRKFMTCHFNHL